MIDTRYPEEIRRLCSSSRDEIILIERLVDRQGLTRDEAMRTVDALRKGKRVEIDPALMEGLESI